MPIDMQDEEGNSLMHFAVRHGTEQSVQCLLEYLKPVDINEIGCGDNSLLHIAAGYGNADIVNLLLNKGANLLLKNEERETPWGVAESEKIRGRISLQIKIWLAAGQILPRKS